jgi:hypothetical protein
LSDCVNEFEPEFVLVVHFFAFGWDFERILYGNIHWCHIDGRLAQPSIFKKLSINVAGHSLPVHELMVPEYSHRQEKRRYAKEKNQGKKMINDQPARQPKGIRCNLKSSRTFLIFTTSKTVATMA